MKIKKILTLFLAVIMLTSLSTVSFAETFPSSATVTPRLTSHKINGTGTLTGGIMQYTSTTTRECSTIKAHGILAGNNNGGNLMFFQVWKDDIFMAGGQIKLDGKEYVLDKLIKGNYPAGTYTIIVQPSFNGGYEANTVFYY